MFPLLLLLPVEEREEGAWRAGFKDGDANLRLRSSSSSSSSSSPLSLFCKAITLANRCAAALAATFWVRLTVEKPPIPPSCFRWAGDIAGDVVSVLFDDSLHWRPYTGLPALLRSIRVFVKLLISWTQSLYLSEQKEDEPEKMDFSRGKAKFSRENGREKKRWVRFGEKCWNNSDVKTTAFDTEKRKTHASFQRQVRVDGKIIVFFFFPDNNKIVVNKIFNPFHLICVPFKYKNIQLYAVSKSYYMWYFNTTVYKEIFFLFFFGE